MGRSPLCDLRLPTGGPKQHVFVLKGEQAFEVRNLSRWHRLKVNGEVKTRALLTSKDVLEIGPVRVIFLDEV